MAIITKPTIAKGQANEFDLSKSDLAVLSKVTSDSYFSDQANWSKVYIEYKSTEGKQIKQVVFDASETAPKGQLELSDKAKDSWEVQAVVIMDFDGGYLKLERGDLTVADFDIAISSGDLGQDISAIYTAFNYLDTLTGTNYFGHSVAVSGDYIVVGDNNSTGSVYVYKINQDDTIALLDTLVGQYREGFGYSVAISGDYIVIGVVNYGATTINGTGAAYVYKINQDNTIELRGTLRGDPDSGNSLDSSDQFGISVAISGNYIVVGAQQDNGANNTVRDSGAAYVYKINQNDTNDTIAFLGTLRGDPNNALDSGDYFGISVAISGNYIVVGAYYDDGDGNTTDASGAAYVYKINQDNTIELRGTLRGDPDSGNSLDSDRFGYSVAISGNYIVVGAYYDDGVNNVGYDSGAAYVYKINQNDTNDTIAFLATLRGDPDNALGGSDRFGYSVAISGNYIVVGSESRAKAYMYNINQDNSVDLFSTLTENITGPTRVVSIDNGYILIGNYVDNNYAGAAYLFKGIE